MREFSLESGTLCVAMVDPEAVLAWESGGIGGWNVRYVQDIDIVMRSSAGTEVMVEVRKL